MKTLLFISMFFHCFIQKDSIVKDSNLPVIVLMALSNPYTSTHVVGDLDQQLLCRTFDNKYFILVQTTDSNNTKYFTDTLTQYFGDTTQLDSSIYEPINKTALDNLLHYEYENDSGRYEELREILIENPPEKPCIYYDPPSFEYRLG